MDISSLVTPVIQDRELLDEFAEALNDRAPEIERDVARLRKAPQDRDINAELFRAVHNIKGDAALCKFDLGVAIAHRVQQRRCCAHGIVNPPRSGALRDWRYDAPGQAPVLLKQGEEMGRFLLGSTVVMLFPKAAAGQAPLRFHPDWRPTRAIRLGEAMAAR